ncbi:C40 family peptidase [Limosilactobacillus balticus]|uniref:C40 family peptidase n=1 Tax=Limosilactobacillus balticus TaxID=2759747 RepID=UPI002873048A|nr:C40 family peptidase [Limosilactobacillus balticus]
MQKKKHLKFHKISKNWRILIFELVILIIGITTSDSIGYADSNIGPQNLEVINNTVTNQQANNTKNIDYNTQVNEGHIDSIVTNKEDNQNIYINGWHATNQYSQGMKHYLITLNGDNNQELNRQKLELKYRPDVQKAYPQVPISGNGGFSASIPVNQLNNVSSIRFVSRYTYNENGEPNGGADFWYPTIKTKAAWLDKFKISGGSIEVAGWHADDQSVAKQNHFLILYDKTKNREITRQKVDTLPSEDVARVYTIANADKSRFVSKFIITPNMLGDEFVLVSRYSDNEYGEGNYSDYWFDSALKVGKSGNAGWLDEFTLNHSNNQVIVNGWHAADKSTLLRNHFLILFDKTTNCEVGRQNIQVMVSSDVAQNGYGNINNADQCRFSATFSISPAIANHQFVLVSRYSDAANGEGNRIDYWYNNKIISNKAAQVVNIAHQQLGKPYVWGATGPNSFDCSGLVQYVYRQIGINLPRTTYQQEYQGTAVSLNALQPGDLLFWGSYGSAYHVAIYIGNGDFIQAPQPGEQVKITNMSYYHPDFARRIL